MNVHVKSDKGFSLLEVILALSILSSCVLLFSFAISQIQTTRSHIKDERQIEWHLFINQLEHELIDSENVSASREQISFQKFDPVGQRIENITYERRFQIIRRQVGALGHQPILLEVLAVEFSLLEEALSIRVEFKNGEEYNAKLRVNEQDSG
ncbi:competence protein ComGF [Alkalibacterium subtropicum]|uniref:Competence protein ComGF n=1 Tax=Alkalibacterium subtropicum TaxID=753702 RepID=A0A1I1GQF4_9LACT|nr:competence type IV pilus minor pilin ComGF [Alkalibacterium subtropicum]SFC14019.1 competence protein ComGF [Alkalibacterium subtropicum]